ncbi:MAG: hypothetical protein A2293_06575 [Elusimicrobia bacterium RIFOXYB2_FULL_49_7]|nr:MAG: hypothetical protein A2293_06575 [Elusimicrobia bacterium RIFOXYB2_FULL_49_7]
MAKAQKTKGKWKLDMNYISRVVSEISQKMDHIVKELRDASFSLDHLADGYHSGGRTKQYPGSHEDYYSDY